MKSFLSILFCSACYFLSVVFASANWKQVSLSTTEHLKKVRVKDSYGVVLGTKSIYTTSLNPSVAQNWSLFVPNGSAADLKHFNQSVLKDVSDIVNYQSVYKTYV